jgi:MFS transporter, SHS family, lactate transporter
VTTDAVATALVRKDPSMSRSPSVPLTPDQRNSFIAALLGWTMDAFDYFLVLVVLSDIAHDSAFRGGVPEARFAVELSFITTATLVMRPIGALLFGLWADRVGRRIPLIVDACCSQCAAYCPRSRRTSRCC